MNDDEPTDEEIAVAVVAVLASRSSSRPDPRPLREPLSAWVASGWVPPTATVGHAPGR